MGILTDTIKSAFSTVFTQAYKNTDAVDHRQERDRRRATTATAPTTPSLPASLLTRVRALPGVAQAVGRHLRQAQLVGHNGKVISSGGAPGLAFSYSPGGPALQPAHADQRQLADRPRTRSTSTPRPRARTTSRSVRRDRRRRARAGRAVPDRRHGQVRRRLLARRRDDGDLHAARGPAAVPQAGPATTRSTSRPSPAPRPQQLVSQIKPLLGPSAQVRTGQAQAAAGDQGHQRVPQHLPGLPARVRRHRAVRRELRDRQHAVDHDRPANPRAGHAAHARRDPPAGPHARCWSRRS